MCDLNNNIKESFIYINRKTLYLLWIINSTHVQIVKYNSDSELQFYITTHHYGHNKVVDLQESNICVYVYVYM